MNISTRTAQQADIDQVIKICKPNGRNLRNLKIARPEEVTVAELNGRIAGCLQYFTDYSDDYEPVIGALIVDPTLDPIRAQAVREKLEMLFREAQLGG